MKKFGYFSMLLYIHDNAIFKLYFICEFKKIEWRSFYTKKKSCTLKLSIKKKKKKERKKWNSDAMRGSMTCNISADSNKVNKI